MEGMCQSKVPVESTYSLSVVGECTGNTDHHGETQCPENNDTEKVASRGTKRTAVEHLVTSPNDQVFEQTKAPGDNEPLSFQGAEALRNVSTANPDVETDEFIRHYPQVTGQPTDHTSEDIIIYPIETQSQEHYTEGQTAHGAENPSEPLAPEGVAEQITGHSLTHNTAEPVIDPAETQSVAEQGTNQDVDDQDLNLPLPDLLDIQQMQNVLLNTETLSDLVIENWTRESEHPIYSLKAQEICSILGISQTALRTLIDDAIENGVFVTWNQIANNVIDNIGYVREPRIETAENESSDMLVYSEQGPADGDLVQENNRLQIQIKCRLCKTDDANALFLPCAHLISCILCATDLTSCPLCNAKIKETVVVYR